MKMPGLLALTALCWLTACANLTPPSQATPLEAGKSYWLSYDASRRGSIIAPTGHKLRSCSEPAPDVAMSFVSSLKGSLTTPGGASATGVDASLNATAQALAGRDDLVLLAREALFRICEASLNGFIQSADVRPLFQDVFQQVKEIAVAQAQTAKSKATTAEAEVMRLKLK
jgi:hypothetical protein